MEVVSINTSQEFLDKLIAGEEPETTIFYNKYDRLIWDVARKWHSNLSYLSKGQYDLDDLHNELWAHIFKNISKCDLERSSLSSWILLISNSKLGMLKRTLQAQKNDLMKNETKVSLDTSGSEGDGSFKPTDLINFIVDDYRVDDDVVFQERILDYIYLLLELVEACTDKERKVYLLKIKGKSQVEIAEEAGVSKSYVPMVYKRLRKKFKALYDSLDDQTYVDKDYRDSLAKDLLSKKSSDYICKRYDIELETVKIFKEILEIVNPE